MILGIELRRIWFIPFFVLVVVNRTIAGEEEMPTKYPIPSTGGSKYDPPTVNACPQPGGSAGATGLGVC